MSTSIVANVNYLPCFIAFISIIPTQNITLKYTSCITSHASATVLTYIQWNLFKQQIRFRSYATLSHESASD